MLENFANLDDVDAVELDDRFSSFDENITGLSDRRYCPSNLNPDLLSVLLRYRMHKIAWIADIEKAFLNIALQPEDAEAIRFLWPKGREISGSPT